jgi:hypothetical protein
LALFEALEGLGGLFAQAFVLGLVHGVTDQAARQRPDGCADDRTLTGMSRRASDDRAGTRSNGPTGQRPGRCSIGPPLGRLAAESGDNQHHHAGIFQLILKHIEPFCGFDEIIFQNIQIR